MYIALTYIIPGLLQTHVDSYYNYSKLSIWLIDCSFKCNVNGLKLKYTYVSTACILEILMTSFADCHNSDTHYKYSR